MRLFAEHGYDATTIAEIAAAVPVAPRTVSLYFPTKLDLAMSYADGIAQRLADAIEAGQSGDGRSGDSTLGVLRRWLDAEIVGEPESIGLLRAMHEKNPTLRGITTPATERARDVMAASIARDLGREADDVAVAIVGGAISGVLAVLLALDPGDGSIGEQYDVAMRLLASAFAAVQQ